MTTWTNGAITKRVTSDLSKSHMVSYTIAGISGDAGGTLTCTGFKLIDNYSIQVEIATGPAGYSTGLLSYPSGNTIVVAYTDPTDAHTVRVVVWGLKG